MLTAFGIHQLGALLFFCHYINDVYGLYLFNIRVAALIR